MRSSSVCRVSLCGVVGVTQQQVIFPLPALLTVRVPCIIIARRLQFSPFIPRQFASDRVYPPECGKPTASHTLVLLLLLLYTHPATVIIGLCVRCLDSTASSVPCRNTFFCLLAQLCLLFYYDLEVLLYLVPAIASSYKRLPYAPRRKNQQRVVVPAVMPDCLTRRVLHYI